MLGLNYAPLGNSIGHIEAMVGKGEEWGDKLTTRPLPRRDAWMSFHNQLLPAMTWGLVAVVLPIAKLDKMVNKVWYRLLHHLGINRCITLEWRTLPERYLGLGMPLFSAWSLSAKIFFLQCEWDFGSSTSTMTS